MVQKEMALRVAGAPGSKDWSPLSIMTQLSFEVRHCFDVPARHFSPPPKVTSSVIKLTPNQRKLAVPYEQFNRVVRSAFRQRRKLLANNLTPDLVATGAEAQSVLESLHLPNNVRAEQVTIGQFEQLTHLLSSKLDRRG